MLKSESDSSFELLVKVGVPEVPLPGLVVGPDDEVQAEDEGDDAEQDTPLESNLKVVKVHLVVELIKNISPGAVGDTATGVSGMIVGVCLPVLLGDVPKSKSDQADNDEEPEDWEDHGEEVPEVGDLSVVLPQPPDGEDGNEGNEGNKE